MDQYTLPTGLSHPKRVSRLDLGNPSPIDHQGLLLLDTASSPMKDVTIAMCQIAAGPRPKEIFYRHARIMHLIDVPRQ